MMNGWMGRWEGKTGRWVGKLVNGKIKNGWVCGQMDG
jgi:hypothetical protein